MRELWKEEEEECRSNVEGVLGGHFAFFESDVLKNVRKVTGEPLF